MNPYKPDPKSGRATDPKRTTSSGRPTRPARGRSNPGGSRGRNSGFQKVVKEDVMTERDRIRSVRKHATGVNEIVLYGRHVVTRAIEKFPGLIKFIFAREDEVAYYRELGKKHDTHCPIHVGTDAELDKKAKGGIHQGVVASLPGFPYSPLQSITSEHKIVLALDQVQDPQNVGALIRSAAALGASAVILPEHDQVGVTGVVARTSVGAVFDIPIIQVNNLVHALDALKERGFWIVGLAGEEGTTPLAKYEFTEPTVLVLGGESDGLREGTRKHCDTIVSIPATDKVESLNVSVAGAIAMYEAGKTLVFGNPAVSSQ